MTMARKTVAFTTSSSRSIPRASSFRCANSRDRWALGKTNGIRLGGRTAAVLYSAVGTCKHLGIDPFAYLREALPGLFALGEDPTAEQLTAWLPDRWQLDRTKQTSAAPAATG